VSDTWDAFPEAAPSRGQTITIPGQGGAPTRVIMNMGGDSWDAFPEAPTTDYGGLAKATGVGIAKGAIGLAGLGGDAQALLSKGVDYVKSKLPSPPEPDEPTRKFLAKYGERGDEGPSFPLPSSSDIQGQVEKVTGSFRQPQNQAETDAQTFGEFLPAAAMGPGGLIRKGITQAAIPAAATITAGRFSDQNPYVKALAGFVGGVGAGALSGPSSAERVLRSKIPPSVTEHDITRAGQLIEHGQARGVDLTWPEALSRVTGQPILTDMMRVLESHPQTRPQMSEFFANRPAQVESAARTEFSNVGNLHPNPSSIGPQAGEAATSVIGDVRGAINKASEPFYQQAESVLLTPAEMSHVRAIPGWTEARDAVRENSQIGWRVEHLPDNSVGFLNQVKKHFDQAAENAGSKFNPAKNREAQSSNEMAASALKQIGEVKSQDYQIALAIQKQARETILDPLLKGPLGQLARKDPTTKRAIEALFQTNPVPGSEGEVRNAVFAIAQKRPAVAEQLVRAHVEMVFNQAAKDLQGGANQFAGAKFAKVLVGQSQERKNLQAAIEALPHGTARWEGLNQLLDISAATGTRQPKGSLTAFNALEVPSMSSAGLASLAAKGASPKLWWSAATDAFQSWSLGHNLDQFARLITNPRSGDALRQIVRIPAGSDRAVLTVGRLITQLGAATTEQRSKPN
jgi:hypothetical protein